MTFVHQALTWGFLLALVPLLIHLINLMRRRRVKWAAMEFLLRSYKKHRKWIWLKQLLLLLARMAAIALVVAMLAQWITQKQWLAIFGATTTHHFVLIDDSYSMSEQSGGASAFDRAKRAMGEIATQAIKQNSQQKFTVVRFSRAATAGASNAEDAAISRVTDFNAEIVDSNFDVALEEVRREMEVTELSHGPRQAFNVLNELLRYAVDENNMVYVLSDFREKEWESPSELRELLQAAKQAAAEVHFVNCIDHPQPNMTITALRPQPGTRAAGVPLFVDVSVRNNGNDTVSKVPVKIRTHFYDPAIVASSNPGKLKPAIDEPPSLLIDKIPAGETVTRRVQVYFPQPGTQVVEASLNDDAVATDNRRWRTIDIADGQPVLLIDETLKQSHSYFMESAFEPSSRTNTGIRPEVEDTAFLRDATPELLQRYHAIYLLDVESLDARAIQNLEDYVQAGGGLGIFVGENVNLGFYTKSLYRNGEGLFPLPLERDDLLPAELLENVPDLEVSDHPIFSVFLGERNPFIRLVTIERYLRTPEDWTPAPDAPVSVIARLRNGEPLAVASRFGEGRVVAFLTTLAPSWNNWAHDPSFVVAMLKLQAYLAMSEQHDDARLVGSPIALTLNSDDYVKDISFVLPSGTDAEKFVVQRVATSANGENPLMSAVLGEAVVEQMDGGVGLSGIYEAWASTRDGKFDVHRYALNPNSAEGNLAVATSQTLLSRLEPLSIRYRDAGDFAYDLVQHSDHNRSMLLMCLLIGLLLAEQLLAFSASYHPAPTASEYGAAG